MLLQNSKRPGCIRGFEADKPPAAQNDAEVGPDCRLIVHDKTDNLTHVSPPSLSNLGHRPPRAGRPRSRCDRPGRYVALSPAHCPIESRLDAIHPPGRWLLADENARHYRFVVGKFEWFQCPAGGAQNEPRAHANPNKISHLHRAPNEPNHPSGRIGRPVRRSAALDTRARQILR
jgi:hypothetical protein